MAFSNRTDAGRKLATRLEHVRGESVIVLGLPRGGVPVAFEVASALGTPLDVIVVRKLGVPFQPELGMGAIGEGGVRVINDDVVQTTGVNDEELAAVETRERAKLEQQARRFRGDRAPTSFEGRTVVIVDDGIATGSTARAACQVAHVKGAKRIILAVPVAPQGWETRIGSDADEFVSLLTPREFFAIGQFYRDFSQTTDDEVADYLGRAATNWSLVATTTAQANDDPPSRDEEIEVSAGAVRVGGHLTIPDHAVGIVVFAHGSGSSRHSPRNRYVAGVLNEAGIGTLLFDLLTMQEEFHRANVFDIDLLSRRLSAVTAWLRDQPDLASLSIGYFGASTGAGAALQAAAAPGANIAAVVSRGGRPDLAGAHLSDVSAPTLLIVGDRDEAVLYLNRKAQAHLRCESRLVLIPGATHLFEEPGTLQAAAEAARDWFTGHFAPSPHPVA